MKLSFNAFVIATMMQSTAAYECSLCDGPRVVHQTKVKDAMEYLIDNNIIGTPDNNVKTKTHIRMLVTHFIEGQQDLINADKRLPRMECWDLKGLEDLSYAFENVRSNDTGDTYTTWPEIDGIDLNCWDTSDVTDMKNMFLGSRFSGSVDTWDTSKVTNMRSMFFYNERFNQPVNHFNTAKVTDMNTMFANNGSFNQPVSNFDTSKVKNFGGMFSSTNFNQDVTMWNTENAENMESMFSKSPFDQNISGWDTSKVTNMKKMFHNNKSFNQNLSGWDVTSNQKFGLLFEGATSFNQCMGSWIDKMPSDATMEDMFKNSGCPWNQAGEPNRDDRSTFCKNDNCSPIVLTTTPFGRFEIRHRQVGDAFGNLSSMEPLLDTDVFFEVGSGIADNSYLKFDVYGTIGEEDAVTLACADGVQIDGVQIATENQLVKRDITLDGSFGIASFTLDVNKLESAASAYTGDKVDICVRVYYENIITTFVDTRIVIDRMYTADLTGDAFIIADPSSGKFSEAQETTVTVSEYFCDAQKTRLDGDVTFKPGQDIRICVDPVQDTNSLFLYKADSFNNVKCSFVGDSEGVEFDINFDGTFNKMETPNDYGCGSFVFVLLNSELAKSESRELSCTGKAVITSERQIRRLSSGSSTDNGNVRTLQETPEDVETTFSIDITITDEDSGAFSASITAFSLAAGSLAAALL